MITSYSSTLVSELRTSTLGPKQYYELYMAIFDALRHLSVYLRDNHPVNHLADLYELVQYAGNIIPRLYLMITVGTVYMSIEDAPVKEIMKDMMEMSRGVQHPTRGLFLRYYLSGQARDHLPQGEGDGPEGNLQDSISFILTNFVEMNKLWVRLQHQGHSREREQRTKERQELQLLVGSNLVRLSQLVDLENYKKILTPLLEQVVQCRDVLAQEYLLEVITQVFPDEFHLHTLDQFLSATARLNPHVNIKSIVIGLMDRLSAYAAREAEEESPEEKEENEANATAKLLEQLKLRAEKQPTPEANGEPRESADSEADSTADSEATAVEQEEPPAAPVQPPTTTLDGESTKHRGIPDNIKLFEIFHEQVASLVRLQRMPIQDTMALLVSLTNLALSIYPDRLDYVDQVLAFANEKVSQHANSADLHSQVTQSHIHALLHAPIRAYYSLFTTLALPNFTPLLHAQPFPTRRAIAGEVAKSLLKNATRITTVTQLEGLLEILKVLIKEGTQQQSSYPGGPLQRKGVETDETIEEQGWLARLVHLLHGTSNDIQFSLIQTTKRAFSEGNDRIKHTTPALVTASLKLARNYKRREHLDDNYSSQITALYKFTHGLISTLYTRISNPSTADLCLRLYILAAQTADATAHEEISYEFFAQAFTVYEESVSDSRAQFQAICVVVSSLCGVTGFGRENYDTLITKAALHGSRLLKKPDQCRAVYLASHLWWATEKAEEEPEEGTNGKAEKKELYRDGKRVLECLQRALRVADACMDTAVSVELFVEILNRYVYYFDQENEAVSLQLM